MKAVHAKRLLKLADFLETLPRKRFSFESYVGADWNGEQDLSSCGTTACALGWAASMPEFRRLGLRLDYAGPSSMMNGVTNTEGDSEYDAAEKVFGVDDRQFEQLFIPGDKDLYSGLEENATAKQVAKNIRRRVADWTSEQSSEEPKP